MKYTIAKVILISVIFFFPGRALPQIIDLEEVKLESYFGNEAAPDFPYGAEWFNTDKQISLKDLRGKLILLDFWTSGCINCIHIIPDLKMLEAKYHDELTVIGVHSAKFLNERSSESIRQAILKYDLEHPVINDKNFEVWDNYEAGAWPTLVLIDPRGNILGAKTGEGVFSVFNPIISSAIAEYDRIGNVLNRKPLNFTLEKSKVTKSLLSYPGKVTADKTGSRIFITDSNNNRLLILKLNETGNEAIVEDVIGSGNQGNNDGTYTDAEFFRPQGIVYLDEKLFVADTDNHLIREIDLVSKQVRTIAGTGKQSTAWGYVEGEALKTPLNSPWDLYIDNGTLYIAMAGSHQLWRLDFASGIIKTFAGSGRESLTDGDFKSSAFSQPSGITSDGMRLYIADTEASAIRSVELKSNGKVKTIVGTGLFDFGDLDGIGKSVRLQHSIGIEYNKADGLIYIADTYNNKVKVLNPETREVKTFSGTGLAGTRDGSADAQFNQPEGLLIVNGKMFITDTNNHLLRVLDMKTLEVKTIIIRNPEMLVGMPKGSRKKTSKPLIVLENAELREGKNIIKFNFSLPEGFKINPDANPVVYITSSGNLTDDAELEISTKSPEFELPVKLNSGMGLLKIEVLVYYCETQNIGICKFKDLNFELPVKVGSGGNSEVNISFTLK